MKDIRIILLAVLFIASVGYAKFAGSHSSMTYTTDEIEGAEYTWRDINRYYYPTFDELLYINDGFLGKCLSSVEIGKVGEISLPETRGVKISQYPISKDLYEWWVTIPIPQQMRVPPELCATYQGSWEGCPREQVYHISSPRCQGSYLKYICESATKDIEDNKKSIHHTSFHNFVLPESHHGSTFRPPVPWILTARDAFVTRCGTVITSCGPIITTADCKKGTGKGVVNLDSCFFNQSIQIPGLTDSCPGIFAQGSQITASKYNKVFVASHYYDSQPSHFILEIIPRIVYHLDFLLQNPDVSILVGCEQRYGKTSTPSEPTPFEMYHTLFDFIGLPKERFKINKHIHADEVYLPMEGGCGDPVYNTWPLIFMRQHILNKVTRDVKVTEELSHVTMTERGIPPPKYRTFLIAVKQQPVGSKHGLSETFYKTLIEEIKRLFPEWNVETFNDADSSMANCFDCKVKIFRRADVLVSAHNSLLSYMLYMKPNSAIVELTWGKETKVLLGADPFSRLASVLSHSMMMHYIQSSEFDNLDSYNMTKLTTHINSFLTAIDFIK